MYMYVAKFSEFRTQQLQVLYYLDSADQITWICNLADLHLSIIMICLYLMKLSMSHVMRKSVLCNVWTTKTQIWQSVHARGLISIFVLFLDSIISVDGIPKFSRLLLASVAEQAVWVIPGRKTPRHNLSWHGWNVLPFSPSFVPPGVLLISLLCFFFPILAAVYLTKTLNLITIENNMN